MPLLLAKAIANWKYLLMGVLVVLLGLSRFQVALLHGDIARQDAKVAQEHAAATLVALEAEKRARAAENAAAQAARTAEEQHAKDLAAIDAGAAAFRVRLSQASRGRNCVPVAASSAGQPAPIATGSVGGHRGVDNPGADELRAVALRLQADVKACWGWAAKAGR